MTELGLNFGEGAGVSSSDLTLPSEVGPGDRRSGVGNNRHHSGGFDPLVVGHVS